MNPSYDFDTRVAFVTGASSGLGFATAQAFAEQGAQVALVDVDQKRLTEATGVLVAAGLSAVSIVCDVTDEDQVASAVEQTVETFGSLDMAFNNAGIMISPHDLEDEPAESFDRVTAVNLRGVWASMKHELRQMSSQGHGAIVNCSSLSGVVGARSRASYASAKHGILGLTRSVSLEYAARGIRINAVCPGTFDTPMLHDMTRRGEFEVQPAIDAQPVGRLGRPEELAAAVLWLCSDGASMVTGAALAVDGGYTAQ